MLPLPQLQLTSYSSPSNWSKSPSPRTLSQKNRKAQYLEYTTMTSINHRPKNVLKIVKCLKFELNFPKIVIPLYSGQGDCLLKYQTSKFYTFLAIKPLNIKFW